MVRSLKTGADERRLRPSTGRPANVMTVSHSMHNRTIAINYGDVQTAL